MIWRVKVDCWPQKGHGARIVRTLFVDADDYQDAYQKGLKVAEDTLPCDRLWDQVEFREAASVTFPLERDAEGNLFTPTAFGSQAHTEVG